MQRAIGRAYQGIQGAYPRRPKSDHSLPIEIGWAPFAERLSELT